MNKEGTLLRFQELGREREPQEEQSWGFYVY